ncbi:MAG: SnoaL-like domain [Solirubrobacterales bacterium]|nr:SnoaL-like domain [Solirubrobacterales bacterium]
MPRDNRKLLEDAVNAYNRRDPDGWVALWTPDCEWHPFLTAREEGDPGYHGHNGIRAWFEDVDEMFSEMHAELETFREVGDRLLVLGEMTAVARGTGAKVRSDVAWVVEPRDERLWRGWSYASHEQARLAAEEAAR